MPPLRRYLRITQHSVLEVRIYMDNPADAQRWLLRPCAYPSHRELSTCTTDGAYTARTTPLTRVIAAVRPLVLPKLREENQLAAAKKGKGKGGKRKGWKDVVVEEDFEVSIFLTETSTRHSILRKEKRAIGTASRGGDRGEKMMGAGTRGGVEGGGVLREEIEESAVRVLDVPAAADESGGGGTGDQDEGELFVSEGEGGDVVTATTTKSKGRKRKRTDTDIDVDTDTGILGNADEEAEEKKKMALETEYDGFSIYGRILCLVVKRRGGGKGKEGAAQGHGQAMMEGWIASTQAGEGGMMDE